MDCKIAWIVLLAPVVGFGQQKDTTAAHKLYTIQQFDNILGKETNRKSFDSTTMLKKEIKELKTDVTVMQESILKLQRRQDKDLLIEKYGTPGKFVVYDATQKEIFGASLFLKELNSNDKGVRIYFAFNETIDDLTTYRRQLSFLASQWQSNRNSKIHLTGQSDTWGRERHNMSLSKDRAFFVKQYMMKEFAIPGDAFEIGYFGEKGTDRLSDTELDFLNRQVYVEVK